MNQRTTLTRREYDGAIRRACSAAFTPDEVDNLLGDQYPKSSRHAAVELKCRGAAPADLPPNRTYSSVDVDAMVEAAELAGWLSDEAAEARRRGLSMAEVRGPILVGCLEAFYDA